MTERDIDTAVAAALDGAQLAPIGLVELEFGSGTVRFWTGVGNFTWNGVSWTGTGELGRIGAIEETVELRAVGLELGLSGVPAEVLTIALQESWQGRAARVWYAVVNDARELVGEPVPLFDGIMDVMTLEEGLSAAIALVAESRQIDLERANVRRYTAEDQRAEYSGDAGCDAVAGLQEIDIVWGGPAA